MDAGFIPQIVCNTNNSLLLCLDPDVGCSGLHDTEGKLAVTIAGKNSVDELVLDTNQCDITLPSCPEMSFHIWCILCLQ